MKEFERIALAAHTEFRKALERLPQIDFNPEWTGQYHEKLVSCNMFVKPVWFVDNNNDTRVLVIPVAGCGNLVVYELFANMPQSYALYADHARGLDLIGDRYNITSEDIISRWAEKQLVHNGRLDRPNLLHHITSAEHIRAGLTLE